MFPLQNELTPRSSISESVVQELSRRLNDAVDSTAVGMQRVEAQAHRFLPNTDLARILDSSALRRLFKELLSEYASGEPATTRAHSSDIIATGNVSDAAYEDNIIESYIYETIMSPGRQSLLALFLYQQREGLLKLFLYWLRSSQVELPSDDDMPFTEDLVQRVFEPRYHGYIFDNQTVFKPRSIKKSEHQQFSNDDRVAFTGKQEHIKDGSSGAVFKATVAQGHWRIKADDGYVIGNPHRPMVVALKSFRGNHDMQSRQEATASFNEERKILAQLRSYKIKHDSIMLDWGSITILDEHNTPLYHSLIFELATFSLTDFLNDENRARAYKTKSLLLERLVDIVEALACLHHNLKTLHLDIKPDNILVFERGLSRPDNNDHDEHELIWKLSDFGLAREKDARPRPGYGPHSNYYASLSSSVPATRHAGAYQAPEIQERDSSRAVRRSDVWSMGCVALMVLAFMHDGHTEVAMLQSQLWTNFKDLGGRQCLFYIRSDSYLWDRRLNSRCNHLDDFEPVSGIIPGTQPSLQAAVHPNVIEWSIVLCDSYARCPEQVLVRELLDVIFRCVLLIDRDQRIRSTELHEKLGSIQTRWAELEDHLRDSATLDNATAKDSFGKYESIDTVSEHQPSMEDSNGHEEIPEPGLQEQIRTPEEMALTENHNVLCEEISADRPVAINTFNKEELGIMCPGCEIHPIHKAVQNKAYDILRALLLISDEAITGIRSPGCDNQTAVELACEGAGDLSALQCIRDYRDKFVIDEKLYESRKNGLGRDTKEILRDLCDIRSKGRKRILGLSFGRKQTA